MEEKKRAIKSVSIDLPDKNPKVLSPPRQQIREFRSCADGEMTSLQRLQKFQEGGSEGARPAVQWTENTPGQGVVR